MRTGNPCSSGSGSPFMPTASKAFRPSRSTSSGVEAVNPSALLDSTMSAPGSGRARSSTCRIGSPSQRALPARSPPTALDTQVKVTSASTRSASMSSA